MSLLQIPTVENATGEVKEIFDEIQNALGMVPNGIRQWSANPYALKVQWEGIKRRLSQSKENQILHAIIRYLMSHENHCKYCIGFNGAMLVNHYGLSQDEVSALKKDPTSAPLSEMEIFDIVHAASHMFVVNTLFKTFKVEQEV